MFQLALEKQKTKKYLIQGVSFFLVFNLIYFIVDGLNMSYSDMSNTYGLYLVIINITLNIMMSMMSALLMNLSTVMVELKGKEGKSTNFGFFSVLFGILTYGCTSCVIAFFASVGIAFSVIALPFAGLPYKLVSLLLISFGLFWMKKELDQGACHIKIDN